MKSIILTCAATLATVVALSAADVDLKKIPPASTKTGVTYSKDIQPIFSKTCYKCHGEKKQKGKLRLDSLAAAMKGNEDGAVIIPGKSEKSPLVQAVSGAIEDELMPPDGKGDPLSKEQIGLIRAWIDQGAK